MPILYELTKDATDELRERVASEETNWDISVDIHEIADSHVPVYHSELLDVAKHDLWLACTEPEL